MKKNINNNVETIIRAITVSCLVGGTLTCFVVSNKDLKGVEKHLNKIEKQQIDIKKEINNIKNDSKLKNIDLENKIKIQDKNIKEINNTLRGYAGNF